MRQLWKLGDLGKHRLTLLPPDLLLALDPFRLFASALGLFVGPLLLTLAFALFLPACRALFLLLFLSTLLALAVFGLVFARFLLAVLEGASITLKYELRCRALK